MSGWQYAAWQIGGMVLYGAIGVVILAWLECRRQWTHGRAEILSDVIMAPFYAVAGVIAFIVVEPAAAGSIFLAMDLTAAAMMIYYARRQQNGGTHGREEAGDAGIHRT